MLLQICSQPRDFAVAPALDRSVISEFTVRGRLSVRISLPPSPAACDAAQLSLGMGKSTDSERSTQTTAMADLASGDGETTAAMVWFRVFGVNKVPHPHPHPHPQSTLVRFLSV